MDSPPPQSLGPFVERIARVRVCLERIPSRVGGPAVDEEAP